MDSAFADNCQFLQAKRYVGREQGYFEPLISLSKINW